MKRLYFGILLIFLLGIAGCATPVRYKVIYSPTTLPSAPPGVFVPPPVESKIALPKKTFRIGEKLIYKAEWLGMDVGTAELLIKEATELNGHRVYHIVGRAYSSPLISKLYRVNDEIDAYIDIDSLLPVRVEKVQREGRHRSNIAIEYDHKNQKATFYSFLKKITKQIEIPRDVLDPLSCIYFFRMKDIKIGERLFVDVNVDEKNYQLEAQIVSKGTLKIKGIGKWDAFVVEPLPWFQGKAKKRPKATFWFSADPDRIPLMMTTQGIPFVGTVNMTLQKAE